MEIKQHDTEIKEDPLRRRDGTLVLDSGGDPIYFVRHEVNPPELLERFNKRWRLKRHPNLGAIYSLCGQCLVSSIYRYHTLMHIAQRKPQLASRETPSLSFNNAICRTCRLSSFTASWPAQMKKPLGDSVQRHVHFVKCRCPISIEDVVFETESCSES